MKRVRIELPEGPGKQSVLFWSTFNSYFPTPANKRYQRREIELSKNITTDVFEKTGSGPTIHVLPGLFADQESFYISYLMNLLDENFKNRVVVYEGFASYGYHKKNRIPFNLGYEAKALLNLVEEGDLVIGYSYAGLICLWLDLLSQKNISCFLINPVVDLKKSLNHLDTLTGLRGFYFQKNKERFFKLYGIKEKPYPSFLECVKTICLPYIQKEFGFSEEDISLLGKFNKLKNFYTILAADDDDIVNKSINSEILAENISRGLYLDVNYGYHTQLFFTHPEHYQKLMTLGILSGLKKNENYGLGE